MRTIAAGSSPYQRIHRCMHRLKDPHARLDDKGMALVEFALVFPVLLLLTFGIIEFLFVWFAAVQLEGAVRDASRVGIIGNTPETMTRDQAIREVILRKGGILLNEGNLRIRAQTYSTLNASGYAPAPEGEEGDAVDFGGPDSIVRYVVSYDWRVLTPILSSFFDNGTITLNSTTLVVNEPGSPFIP